MRRYLQQGRGQLVVGWLLALFASAIYLLTLAPTVSFWDCGEFITTNYQLSIGHPPGAPLYQLLAHAFTWFAGDNLLLVARCSNALSALSGGLTIMFLYWILLLLFPKSATLKTHAAALIGALCYLFCDTAWFSAVESEVYALAVLFAAMTLWAMLRWYYAAAPQSPAPSNLSILTAQPATRWLFLVALLLGLGLCVHLLTLLVTPALLLIFLFRLFPPRPKPVASSPGPSISTKSLSSTKSHKPPSFSQSLRSLKNSLSSSLPTLALLLAFFFIGLSPYLIIPIRASVNPPINFIHPATPHNLKRYLSREQYEHAPLYPRIWRNHPHDQEYASDWSGGNNHSFFGNMRFFCSYQVGYMYLRYLMWNFSGRFNDYRGYGSLHNGQFVTGIPPIDHLILGTGSRPPDSLTHAKRQCYYLLPLLLGLLGLCFHASFHKRSFWTVMALFLVSGLGLAVFLNHPTYEPRERDYAYELSFFAFAIWIGWGALFLLRQLPVWLHRANPSLHKSATVLLYLLLFATPALMAAQNWPSHDRSHNFVARESALNLLNSCDKDAILFTMGDNDTFPLWYAQQVEGVRTDVSVFNVNLLGSMRRIFDILDANPSRPVFFSHYAFDDLADSFSEPLLPEGIAFHLLPDSASIPAAVEASCHKMLHAVAWSPLDDHLDEVSYRFLASYWDDVLKLADNLILSNRHHLALQLLDKAALEFPPDYVRDPQQFADIAECFLAAGKPLEAHRLRALLKAQLLEQLDYYYAMPIGYQRLIPFTIRPREEILDILSF